MSETVQLALIATFVPIMSAILGYLALRSGAQDRKLEKIDKTTESIHTLSNHNYQVSLESILELAEWKARETGLPRDIERATKARQALENHMAQQATVDAAAGKRAE